MANLPTVIRIDRDRESAREAETYGRDVFCLNVRRTGRYATGVQLIAQNVYHRLITQPRELQDTPQWGLGLEDLIGELETNARGLEQRIVNEIGDDDRILEVDATVTRIVDGPAVRYEISVECVTALGSFELVVGVDDVTVGLLRLDFQEAA